MNLKSAADLMDSLEILHRTIRWIECPFCGDEVSKLRPCLYWTEGKDVKTHVCVECAESVKGLSYLAVNYPIPGIDITTELMEPYKPPLDPKYINHKSWKAKVFLGEWAFWVNPSGNRLVVLENGKQPEQEKKYDNTFQVWFALKAQFEKGEDPMPESTFKKGKWGKLGVLIISLVGMVR